MPPNSTRQVLWLSKAMFLRVRSVSSGAGNVVRSTPKVHPEAKGGSGTELPRLNMALMHCEEVICICDQLHDSKDSVPR